MLQLRNERRRRGWSQTQVSALTGISSPDLSAIERGAKPAFPGWRRKLAEAFKLPEDQLFAVVEERDSVGA